MKKSSSSAIWIIMLVVLVAAATTIWQTKGSTENIPYSSFQQKWKSDEIVSIAVNQDKMLIQGKTSNNTLFTTYAPSNMIVSLMTESPKENVRVEFDAPSNSGAWLSIIPIIVLVVMVLVFLFVFTQQSQGGGGGRGVMNFGKSRAKIATPDSKKVRFNDVAGADEEKAELEEIVDFLKLPAKYIEMGARIPKGVLLVGPPGTGKTLLAKAIAGEAGVPFFSISGSDFVEMFVGVGASRVRDLFQEAKKNAPCIVFIDEIDAVGRQRGAGLGGGHDEREQTLNQLLSEMDGFDSSKGIVILAATNRPEILDKALLRPGRFDRRVIVDRPDFIGREAILKVHAKDVILDPEVNLKEIAKGTPGAVGADLANMINEGALRAVKHGRKKVLQEDLRDAVEVIIAGKEKKDRILSDKEKKTVAFHEVGHALVAALLKGSDPVHKITIVPRTMGALGYTMQLPEEEKYLSSKEELMNQVTTLLGGRSAEEEVFGEVSTGASNDIERATQTARSMVTVYGMTDRFDMVALESVQNRYLDGRPVRSCSEETSTLIDEEILKIVKEAHNKARTILRENRDLLDKVSNVLLEKETLFGDDFMNMVCEKYPELKKEEKKEDLDLEDKTIEVKTEEKVIDVTIE